MTPAPPRATSARRGRKTPSAFPGVENIHVVAAGAPGAVGATGFLPGIGSRVSGDLAVTPGQTLYVNVSGTPTKVGCVISDVACTGGFNGGGSSRFGGGGGGASDVRTITRDQSGSLGCGRSWPPAVAGPGRVSPVRSLPSL